MRANSKQRRRSLRQTSLSFFLERASASNFCCATKQNNPRKDVSYDRSRPLGPHGKFFSWAPPLPLRNFYPLAPTHPLRISIDCPWGGGGGRAWIFSEITNYMAARRYRDYCHGRRARTGFSHELVKYLKSNE